MSDAKMKPMPTDLTRRNLLFGLMLGAAMMTFVPAVQAKDGDDDSGSGSSNSGSGSDDSDDEVDDDDDDEDTDDDNSGSGGRLTESQRAQAAVKARKAVSLRTLLSHLKRHYPGKVLDVDLRRSLLSYRYDVKILSATGKVQKLRFNALTLQKI